MFGLEVEIGLGLWLKLGQNYEPEVKLLRLITVLAYKN